jgi:hypothetical protein
MLNGINTIRQLYLSRGLKIVEIRADREFECLKSDLLPCMLNIAAPGEHVPEIEQSIWTVKEATRTLQYNLPFKRQPKMMTEGNIFTCIKNLNALPALNRISKTLSPSALITGKSTLDFNNLLKIKYGDYAQVFTKTCNDMTEHTVSAVAIYPTGNFQASWYFLSLATGKRITGYQWTVLPITADVITRVHDLANDQNQERIEDGGNLSFKWRPEQSVMTFYDTLEEDVDQINIDYVQQDELDASDDIQPPHVEKDDFSNISPEIGDTVLNTAPTAIVPNVPVDNLNPITASIEHQKSVQFKEREEIINNKERESVFDNNIESLT